MEGSVVISQGPWMRTMGPLKLVERDVHFDPEVHTPQKPPLL